jgi:hypothetical protein
MHVVGQIIEVMGPLPAGCLPCDGSPVDRKKYPDLWARLPARDDGQRRTPIKDGQAAGAIWGIVAAVVP